MGALPPDPEGYAVDVDLGFVHARYAEHAVGLPRTRSAAGVAAMLSGGPVRPCSLCYPPPPPPPAPPRARRREPVAAPEPVLPPADPLLIDTLYEGSEPEPEDTA